jgi:hypothetical protein
MTARTAARFGFLAAVASLGLLAGCSANRVEKTDAAVTAKTCSGEKACAEGKTCSKGETCCNAAKSCTDKAACADKAKN